MRLVANGGALAAAVQSTSSMAQSAFGDGSVYLERFVETARHVEMQIFGFGDGSAVHLFERDCSLQRRHQKVIEESPAPGIAPEVRAAMASAAVKLAAACNYQGAGTIEFLYDTRDSSFYFLEMNTRIQVEHPVTEMITGVDLVAAQIRLAMGETLGEELAQSRIRRQGHAIEARIYAEKPAKNFIPSPGPLTVMQVPQMQAVRFETGYREGNRVTPFYDPLVMKVIAHGADRSAAVAKLTQALAATRIEGIATNLDYLQTVLRFEEFTAGRVHTKLLVDHHALLTAA
jgi:acetyl/propionyl-CoA carboxylase alpha subunit